jgi:formylmethanofuran dehydrogenase subunit B
MEIHTDVICPFCGCLCDDIEVTVDNNKIINVKNSCGISRSKFMNNEINRIYHPSIDGKTVSYEEAVKEAANILANSVRPLIYGLSKIDNEAIRKAVYLAELIGGVVDNTASICHGSSIIARQTVGSSASSLGEVKNRGDLIIFWGSNPMDSHPRHLARYSVIPKGKYIPNGRKDRYVIVVDVRETRTSKLANEFIMVKPDSDFEIIQCLRAAVRGEKIQSENIGGVPINVIEQLANRMKSAKYGCMFYGLGLNHGSTKHLNIEALYSLVSDLNHYTKFVVNPMRGIFNVTGAGVVPTWLTGYPFGVDMSRGYPRYNPGEYTSIDLLAREEADAALIMGSDPGGTFPIGAAKRLAKIPTITLERKQTPTTMLSKVVIPVATLGIESSGGVYRMDEVPLEMRKVVEPPKGVGTDAKVLEDIIAIVESLKRCN